MRRAKEEPGVWMHCPGDEEHLLLRETFVDIQVVESAACSSL
jgi:hypothetical protein